MLEGAISIKKAIPLIALMWVLSLLTTLAVVYYAPNIFPPITGEKIADTAVTTTKLADGSVTSAKIKDGTLTTADLADGSITSIKVADSAVITTKLADGSVTSAKILDGSITAVDLADGSIIAAKVAEGAVTTAKIAEGAVTTARIADSAIISIKLADGSVTSAKILDGAVTAADLATGSVSSLKIVDGAITSVKLAPYAIPFASVHSTVYSSTTETRNWVDMTGMSLTLTLDRTSHLLIMFNIEAMDDEEGYGILVQALVGTTVANPGQISLTPIVGETAVHKHTLSYGSYGYIFYQPSVSAGMYIIKIQWKVTGGTGHVMRRTLNVIALPT